MTHRFCRDAAIAAGEPLAGTGAIYDRLLLLAWPRRHWRMPRGQSTGMGADLSAAVDHAIASRVHLILCDRPGAGPAIPALQSPGDGTAADFDDEAALAAAIRAYADGAPLPGRPETRTTILCCTDSRRDACCARYGQATFTALLAACDPARHQLLQASHLGGCRFAASLMVFPRRERYGRLEPANVPAFLAAIDAGEPFLPAFRGRGDQPAPEQVAEIAARQWAADNALPVSSLHLAPLGQDGAQARFRAELGRSHLSITLERIEAEMHGTCTTLATGRSQPSERWQVSSIAPAVTS